MASEQQLDEAQTPEQAADDEFSWQIMFDLSFNTNTSIIVSSSNKPKLAFPFAFDLYYKRFFIQSNSDHFSSYNSNVTVGYQLYSSENYQIDLITRSYQEGFDEEGVSFFDDKNPPELEGINRRRDDSSEGLRMSYYLKRGTFWLDVVADVAEKSHGGWIIDSYYSKVVPYRNWDIYLGGGLTIYSGEFSDYYYGVDADEVNDYLREYTASSSHRFQLEVVAQHPLSESWLIAAGVHLSHYSSSIARSPLVKKHNNAQLILDFRYVF